MVSRGTPLPKKLKRDAIVEALLEIRFEQAGLSEVFYGRLLDHPHWKGKGKPRRTGIEELPKSLVLRDPALRYAPVLEILDGTTTLRLGPRVVSFHRRAPYPGWDVFRVELRNVVESLFTSTDGLAVERLGMRYINVLSPQDHGISALSDMDLVLSVAEDRVVDGLSLQFLVNAGRATTAAVRVATKGLVQGELPANTAVLVDVDVFCEQRMTTMPTVLDWLEFAHETEKVEFFHLFKAQSLDQWSVR